MKTPQTYALRALRVTFILFFLLFQVHSHAQNSLMEPMSIAIPSDKNGVNFQKTDSEIPTFRQMLGVNVKVFNLENNLLSLFNGENINGASKNVSDVFSHFRVFYPCNRDYWQNGDATEPFGRETQIPKNNMSKLQLLVDSNGVPVSQDGVSGAQIISPTVGPGNKIVLISTPVSSSYLNPYKNYINNSWVKIKSGHSFISSKILEGKTELNPKLTVTLEVIAKNIFLPQIPNPNYDPNKPTDNKNKPLMDDPTYSFPRRWFQDTDWGSNPDERKLNAKAFATMFARAYSPKPKENVNLKPSECVNCVSLVDILEIGNEPWGYTDPAVYHSIVDGFIEGIKEYYDDPANLNLNKIQLLPAAFQANHTEISGDAVVTNPESWKDYVGSRISGDRKSSMVGVNLHAYSNTINGSELTKNVIYPEKIAVDGKASSRFYYIRNAWKWADDNLAYNKKNLYVSEFGWDSERCDADKSVGEKTQAFYTIRNLLMMGRYGVKRATAYELTDDTSIDCEFAHFANGIWTSASRAKYIFKALENFMQKIGGAKFHCALKEDANGVFSYILEKDDKRYLVAWLARNINYFEDGNLNKPLSDIIQIGKKSGDLEDGTRYESIPLNFDNKVYQNSNTDSWYSLDGETVGALNQSQYYANGKYKLSPIPILIPIVESNTGCVDLTPPTISRPQSISVTTTSTACVNQTWNKPVPTDDCTATPMLSVVANSGVVITDNGLTNSGCFPVGTTTIVTYTAKDAANKTTSCSFNVVVASPQTGGNYCASTSSGPWEDWVRGVKFGTISNNFNDENGDGKNSPQNTPGYSNYTTTLQTTVTKGQSYPIVVKPGYSWDGRVVNQYCRVWLDCNRNGLFEDSEKVEAQGANPISLSIPIPATAITGATRMRVSLKSGGYPIACEAASNFAKGEVEDYTVNIIGGTDLCATDVTSPVFTSCPSNITVPTTSTSAVATWATPTATDNCGTPTVAGNRNSGESFPVGPTNVTYTATDVKGNIATCIFTVTVSLSNNPCANDVVQPTFTNCPSDITAVIPVGATCVTKSWVIPTAYDLCTPNPPLSVTTNNSSVTIPVSANSACFQVGTTAITYKATDAKGNMGTCSFNVVATQQSVSANDMSVTISATGTPVSANSSPLVKVQVQNLGSQAFTNVKIKVPFPSGAVTGSTPTPSSGTWSEWCPGVQCFEWTIPSLGANTIATLNLPMYIQNVIGQMTVTATLLSAAPTDGNAANNQASVSLIGNGVQALIAQQSNRTILQGGQNKSLGSALKNTITEPLQGFNQPQLQENYKISPNPTTGTVIIDIFSLKEEDVVFDFYDAIGRIVKKENIRFFEGNNRFIFDLPGLNKGLYFITIDSKYVRYRPLRVAKM